MAKWDPDIDNSNISPEGQELSIENLRYWPELFKIEGHAPVEHNPNLSIPFGVFFRLQQVIAAAGP